MLARRKRTLARWPLVLLVACRAGEPTAPPSSPPLPLAPPPVVASATAQALSPGVIYDPEIVRGTYPIEVLARAMDKQVEPMRACAQGIALPGKVVARFVIARNGAVAAVQDDGSDVPDERVVQCVLHHLLKLEVRPPEGGEVVVRYRLELRHGE